MKKALRIIGVIVVVVVILAAIIASMYTKPSIADQVWDQDTTIGNIEAKNYFIIYSDLVCPYCVAMENAIVEHEEEFQKYIEENDILYEVRISDFLYEYGEARAMSSRYSAMATYCAKREGKFWDYYNKAVTSVWNDYFKEGGKSAFGSLNAAGQDYWTKIGKGIGLGEDFENCVNNQEPLDEIQETAAKTAKLISGMPYYKFNNYIDSSFSLSWGWEHVLTFFQAGLDS